MVEYTETKLNENDFRRKKIERLSYELSLLTKRLDLRKTELDRELEDYARSLDFDKKVLEHKRLVLEQEEFIAKNNIQVVDKQIASGFEKQPK